MRSGEPARIKSRGNRIGWRGDIVSARARRSWPTHAQVHRRTHRERCTTWPTLAFGRPRSNDGRRAAATEGDSILENTRGVQRENEGCNELEVPKRARRAKRSEPQKGLPIKEKEKEIRKRKAEEKEQAALPVCGCDVAKKHHRELNAAQECPRDNGLGPVPQARSEQIVTRPRCLTREVTTPYSS
ncbi:hypothetical protein HPB50_021615 [Hyalomma asiaticum]|uniref:Uncharacterized protein n=1 Tax=Hyalomma asiaticum TaxID=266040 RepID=A0ACB7SY43_HYAAI|nr:hypothetical protein HPB50_021615 [Hyalomma asiaticum]